MRDNNLISGEVVVHKAKPHWIIFWPTLFWLLITLLLLVFGTKRSAPDLIDLRMLLMALTALLAVLFALPALVTYLTSSYVVTNKRLLMKAGLLRRISLEIRSQRIESIIVEQSLLGQVLNYGSIVINGVGGSRDAFYSIPAPMQFRNSVQNMLDVQHAEKGK